MAKIVITGGSSGLGKEIVRLLQNRVLFSDHEVVNLDINADNNKAGNHKCDVRSLGDLKKISEYLGEIDILINCAGINFIDWIENISDETWDKVMDVNAKGIFNTTKAFMNQLIESKGAIVNIVSNASHMPMTNSIAYNASKGAAHIMTLQMARELGPKGVTVFGISPNKLSGTGMSEYIDSTVCELRGWTEEQARSYQLAGLPAGEETDPAVLAEFIAFILSSKERHKYMAGTIIPYGK